MTVDITAEWLWREAALHKEDRGYMKQFIKKAQSVAFVASLLFSIGMGALPHAHAATTATSLTATPRVTFTFDDGLQSALTQAAPTLQKYGITGTSYIITHCVGMGENGTADTCLADNTKPYMSWAEIKQLQTMGWNIGSHTQTHPYLASTGGGEQALMTDAQVDAELKGSKADLAAQGIDAVDFAAPYGDYNNFTLADAAKYYATFRGFADTGLNAYPYNDRLIVNEQIQEGKQAKDGAPTVTLATAKTYVDQAIANNQWLTLTFHNISATAPTSSDDYTTSTALLDQIAAYVKTQVDAGKISVVSPHDAIVNGIANMLGDGSFDTATLSTDWQNRNTAALQSAWITDDQTGTLVRKDTGNNGSYVLGSTTSPTNSLYVSAGAGTSHIWAPRVAVNPATTYIVKGYFNILTFTPTTAVPQPEVSYHVEEFDATGAQLTDTYASSAVRYDPSNVNAIRAKNANFTYKPSSASVAYARVYIDIQGGGGITGYMDNLEMIDPNGTTTTPPADTTAPVISTPTATPGSTSAIINWNTDEAADTQVAFGTTNTYGTTTPLDTALATLHSVTLTGLLPSTTYHYQVISKDAAGNIAQSADLTFTTTASGTVKPGDLNSDGLVNDDDANTMFANWGPALNGSTTTPGDVNHDGIVNDDDANTMFANWSI